MSDVSDPEDEIIEIAPKPEKPKPAAGHGHAHQARDLKIFIEILTEKLFIKFDYREECLRNLLDRIGGPLFIRHI